MNARNSFKKAADILKYFEDLFEVVTRRHGVFRACSRLLVKYPGDSPLCGQSRARADGVLLNCYEKMAG